MPRKEIIQYVSKFVFMKLHRVFRGSSNAYVIVILIVVAFVSLLLAGGLFPKLVRNPENAQSVEVTGASSSARLNTLQLVNLQIASEAARLSQQECLNESAVLLLIDESSSMNSPAEAPKIAIVKTAAQAFLATLTPDTLVGLTVFSGVLPQGDPRILVPFNKYRTNGGALLSALSSIRPEGGTFMDDGLTLVKTQLQQVREQNPDLQLFLIFLSDGTPSGTEQNPTRIATEIKQPPLDTAVYTILTGRSVVPGEYESAVTLMQTIASDPYETFFLDASSSDTIEVAYQSIAQRLCQ